MYVNPLVINPGELRHSVTISAPSSDGDAFGAGSNIWTPILTTRASLKQITAKTLFQTGALISQATHILRMRYTSTVIEPGYRVTYSTHTYRVVNVDNVQERNRVLEILLLEINGNN
jgi:head-tail adaptor